MITKKSTPEEINAWFASQIAQYSAIIAELRTITGREYANSEDNFIADIERRRNDKLLSFDFVTGETRAKVEQMQRNLDGKRAKA